MSFAPVLAAAGAVSLSTVGSLPLALHAEIIADDVIGQMLDPGLLPSGETPSYSGAYAVSADGAVVVGTAWLDSGIGRGFYWTSADGMREIDAMTANGQGYSDAIGISADGRFIGGWAQTSDGRRHAYRLDLVTGDMVGVGTIKTTGPGESTFKAISADGSAITGTSETNDLNRRGYRWTASGGIEDLGTLGGARSEPTDISADGKYISGSSNTGSAWRAFRWDESAGMEDLGTLTGASTYGQAISADGSTVVGHEERRAGFRWTQSGGMQPLGTLASGDTLFSRPYAVNLDGTVVVGQAAMDTGVAHAFRWEGDDTGGAMVSLGTLCNPRACSSRANLVTPDGSIVAGSSDTNNGDNLAFRWTQDTGMEALGTLKVDNTGYSYVLDMSADGSVIVGASSNDDNDERAFIWRAGAMQDFENLLASFPVLGNDSAVAQGKQQFALGQVMSQGSFAAAGQTVMSARIGGQITGRNPTTVGARTTSLAALSFGRGISDTFTLGGAISLSGTSLKNNAFDMDTSFGVSIWGQYSEDGATRTGLQLSGALGYMRTKGEIARGRLLTNVALATGQSKIETRAVQASLGYGFQQGSWLVTPSFGVAHYDTTRAAYTERGAGFNASYDAISASRTVATLSITGEFAIGEQGRLSLGAGVDQEVNPERPRLTGTSDIPGLATFDIGSTLTTNRTRAFATLGYTHDFGNGSTISSDVRVGQAVYGSTPSVGLGVTYAMRF